MRGMLAFYAPTHNVTHPRDNMEDEFPLPGAAELLWTGFLLGGSIFAGAALLELTVVNTVRAIISTAEGLNLYTTAWMHNAINHLILAPIIYLIGAKLFGSAASRPLGTHMLYSAGVLFVHGIGYYITHRAMHTKALWWAHRFHHKVRTPLTRRPRERGTRDCIAHSQLSVAAPTLRSSTSTFAL